MNRQEMIFLTHRKLKQKNVDVGKTQVAEIIDSFVNVIEDELLTNGTFTLSGLFTLNVLSPKRRKFHDCLRNCIIERQPKKRLTCRTGKKLKERLNAIGE